MGKSRFLGACVVLLVTLLAGVALAASADGSRFSDDDGNTHEVSIEAIASEGITNGCNPPANTRYCPGDPVTRGQMAAFLHRALDGRIVAGEPIEFVDDNRSTFEADIEWLAATGITKGCNPPENDRFCPDDVLTRGQMAAFMVRAMGYRDYGGGDLYIDDERSVFEEDIDKLGTAGVTRGCNPPANDRYCPNDPVLRDQMASFLARALSLGDPGPPPSTSTTSSPSTSIRSTTTTSAATTTTPSEPVLGTFVDESSLAEFVPDPDTLATHIAPIDYDLDSDVDLFITIGNADGDQEEANLFLENDGEELRAATAFSGVTPGDFTHVAFGKIDGDDRVDAVLSLNIAPARLLLFDPAQSLWVDSTSSGIPPGQPDDATIASELFDCDDDGDLDFMTAAENPFIAPGAPNRLYINDGTGRFSNVTSTNMPDIRDDSAALAVADFDSDGDIDVITVNANENFYLENDGDCGFIDDSANHLPPQPVDQDSGRDAVVADFDVDGDLDVIFAISRNEAGPVLWLNDGQGVFTDATADRIPVASLANQALVACDLEGDGDLDLVLANSGQVLNPATDHLFEGAPERILINDGSATFSDASDRIPQADDGSQAVACADVTGDGRLDIIVGNGKGETLRIYVQR